MLVKGLQCYMRSKPNLTYSRIGGANGEKLTRMAFAVIIKLSGLAADLQIIVAELDYASISLSEEEGPARDKEILEVLQSVDGFENVLRYWIIASRMRIWFNGKR